MESVTISMDQLLFEKACEEVIGQLPGTNGIGTLGEKTVHSVLKNYLSPDSLSQEIKIGGFVADICTGTEIIEIQTRHFDKLRRKLKAFLAAAPVTIVYPVPYIKWVRWVNPQTGEISHPRKSPKKGTPYSVFPELYKIKLRIVLMNLEEYKYLDGWSADKKRGSTRCDRIPIDLVDELLISDTSDYQLLIPEILEGPFCSKDYQKASGLSLSSAQTALNILYYVGAVDRIGKRGNSYLYERSPV